jgi:adenosylcobinamide kinase/adenosylcobinamide-phosphate guanylyltransferase
MAELILITGGARSGKSTKALELAEGFRRRVFIATAEAVDDEMRERISRHQAERGDDWETIEAPLDLAGAIRKVEEAGAAVVVDCLTVWLGNLMYHDPDLGETSPYRLQLLNALKTSSAGRIILVTNEVGMGIVPENTLARRYRDMAGRLNQDIAALADRVILSVCGQSLMVKDRKRSNISP